MFGALTNRTPVTGDALPRAARLHAAAGHERHSCGELSAPWLSAPVAINILLFTTEVKQCIPFSPPCDCSYELKITFCVRGVFSPLLSNLVLDELDRQLECRGLRFVRYADDCNIYVRSERAGQRVMKSITQFITQKLKLKVNEAKSAIARPQERKFLGFSFTAGPEVKRIIAPKALERFKQRVREITRRAKSVSIEKTMEELAPYMRGWRTYFGFCETPAVLQYLTRWV